MKRRAFYFLPLLLSCWLNYGCSTVNEKRVPLAEDASGKGSVSVLCYDDMADMKIQLLTKRLMMMALYDGKPGRKDTRMVGQAESQVLEVGGLLPGTYYLRISGWKGEDGKLNTSKSMDYKLNVEEGKETLVSVIVTDYMKSGILVGGVVVGALTLASAIFTVVLVMAIIAAI